jgi:hypothetical protein
MSRSGRRHRRDRLILAILAIAWLPYVSTRCLAGGAGCCVAAGPQAAHHDDSAPPAREQACCALTGRCAVEPSAQPVPASPLVAVALGPVDPSPPPLVLRVGCSAAVDARDPPAFIRFSALLI